MTHRLILTRHAKSDWSSGVEDDFDRPLNKRGQKAAPLVGKWLLQNGYMPDVILCSAAIRTQETCDLITETWPTNPQTVILRDLYLASAQEMLDCLRSAGDAPTVMMIAHNPGTATMAAMLAGAPHPHGDFLRYPTAFTTILDFDITDWSEADWGMATATDAIAARDLT